MIKENICWLDNDLPDKIKKLFNLIDIFWCVVSSIIFISLGLFFSSLNLSLSIGIVIILLILFLPRIGKYLRHAIKIGHTSEGISYIMKSGKKGFISWDKIESVKPIICTKNELYNLFYRERKTTNILAINKNVLSNIKPYLRNVKITE